MKEAIEKQLSDAENRVSVKDAITKALAEA